MPTPERTAASTFNRVAIDLAHDPFPELAGAIRGRIDPILKHWREVSLTAMPHLDALTLKEFENSIGAILSAAADAFASAEPRKLLGVMQVSPWHGVARFVQEYGLLDLFEEVRILRGVVILELAQEMKRPLNVDESATFHAIFDIIIQQGVMALVQRHDEQMLLASARQNELAAIVECSDDAIISEDLNGNITTWNKGAERLFGFTVEEAVGKPITMLIPEDRLCEEPNILGRIRRGESIDHYETVRRRKDGTQVNISLTVSPLRDAKGRVTGASKIARNITDRVSMEKQIKEQAEALRSLRAIARAASP
ncbi:MAG: PAS domain S-box protein [Phycisphaerales bacterium]|nr:PAS domain S-box protein [Phycisphaerales bacterium]